MTEVGVAQLRRDLKHWLARAQAGDDVVVTERGAPVARLSGVDAPGALQRLVAEGLISQPARSRPDAGNLPRVHATADVSDYVVAERTARRG
jgi:prevent-host-death family protein